MENKVLQKILIIAIISIASVSCTTMRGTLYYVHTSSFSPPTCKVKISKQKRFSRLKLKPAIKTYKTEILCKESSEFKASLIEFSKRNEFVISYKYGSYRCEQRRLLNTLSEKPLNMKDSFKTRDSCDKSKILASLKKKQKDKARRSRIKKAKAEIKRNQNCERYRTLILAQKIKINMPEQCLYISWGKPRSTNETVGSWGVNKQLIYPASYVYIRNGVVSSWQTR